MFIKNAHFIIVNRFKEENHLINNKEDLIQELRKSTQRVMDYEVYSNSILQTPINDSKWSPYEIVGHLAGWDSFMLKKRIPQLILNLDFIEDFEVENNNKRQNEYVTKLTPHENLQRFIQVRKLLITQIQNISQENWQKEFIINDEKWNFTKFFNAVIEHDDHHLNQIDEFLKKI